MKQKKNGLIKYGYLLEKTIYPKMKKWKFDETMLKKILQLEIDEHLKKFPEMKFEKFGQVNTNDDRSKTYQLIFIPKNQIS